MDVVTRFAPSPTGYLHIGGLRTALYSYLFAKKHDGTLILRIEDTDQTRYVEGSVENLIKSLEWGGIKFDEGPHVGGDNGPYMQSERTEHYRKHAQMLIESGHAYKCFCTKERLEEMRAHQQKHKQPPMYDRKCLYLEPEQIKEKEDAGIPYVIRLKIPHDETIHYHDMVRGDMEFKGHTIDDQVLVKSDGFPTYHLANVVDDHMMKVTHVIRGEEWLPSTPKHIFLYHAFGWKEPQFAHIPLLLNEDKTKLSKRQGHVAVEEYIKEGYISEAVVNYIAMLGWNPGSEQEIFNMEELIKSFELGRVQKAGAIFSMTKLNWFNKQYLKNKPIPEIAEKITPFMNEANISIPEDTPFFHKCIELTYERYNNYSEAPEYLQCLLESPTDYDTELFIHEKMKVDKVMSLEALETAVEKLNEMSEFNDEEEVKAVLVEIIGKLSVKNGQVLWPIRVALTNKKFSPGVFELLVALKKERAIPRLLSAIESLKN